MNWRWYMGFCLWLTVAFASSAWAQSANRVPEAVTTEFGAPDIEDLSTYLYTASPKKAKNWAKYKEDGKREKAIASVEKLLEGNVDKLTKGKLLLRLALLFEIDAIYERKKEVNSYREDLAVWQSGDMLDKRPEPDFKKSNGSMTKAIRAYRDVMSLNQRYANRADILYNVANLLARTGNDNAILYWRQVVKAKPRSGIAARSNLGIADFHLAQGKVKEARPFYRRALKGKDRRVKKYAKYKQIWLALESAKQVGKAELAAAEKGLLEIARGKSGKKSGPEDKYLQEQAKLDLVWVWSEGMDENKAKTFFGAKDDLYFSTVERIGWKHQQAGNTKLAAAAYLRLLKEAPARTGNFAIHARMVKIFHESSNEKAVVATINEMSETYLSEKSRWWQANNANTTVVSGNKRAFEQLLNRYGMLYHRKGVKSNDRNSMLAAANIFGLYVKHYPEGENAYTARYAYADALERIGQTAEAARQYFIVAKMDKNDAKFRSPASEKALAIQTDIVKKSRFPKVPELGKVPKPMAIPKQKEFLVEIIDMYIKFFPTERKVPGLRYTAGFTYVEHGHYDKGFERLNQLAKASPSAPEAAQGAKVVLSVYEIQGKWSNLISASRGFLKIEDLAAQPGVYAYFRGQLRTGMWNYAGQLVKAKKAISAAEAYVAFKKEFPRDPEADKALHFATTLYLQEGKGVEGVKTGTELVKVYRESKYRANTQFTISGVYEELVEFESAANGYQSFARMFPTDQRAAEALYRAAGLYRDAENPDAANQILRTLYTKYGNSANAAQARLDMAKTAEQIAESGTAITEYREFARLYSSQRVEDALFARAKVVQLTQAARGHQELKSEQVALEQAVARLKPTQAVEARDVLVEARMHELRETFFGFPGMTVSYYDEPDFERSNKEIQAKIKQVESAYGKLGKIASYEYQVATLYTLGKLYKAAREAYMGKPNPNDLPPPVVDKLETGREKALLELQMKMQNAWEAAIKLADRKGLFTKWQRLAHNELAKILPSRYQLIAEATLDPVVTMHRVRNEAAVADLKD